MAEASTRREEEAIDALEELAAIWERVPIPRDSWHPGAEAIARLDTDVRAALGVLAADGAARATLVRILDGDRVAATDESDPALRRLAELPRPDGKHPYLADVLPGFEAAEAILRAAAQRAPASNPTGS